MVNSSPTERLVNVNFAPFIKFIENTILEFPTIVKEYVHPKLMFVHPESNFVQIKTMFTHPKFNFLQSSKMRFWSRSR